MPWISHLKLFFWAGNVSSQNSVSTTSFTLPPTEQSIESDSSAPSDCTEANSVVSRTEEELIASSHLRRFCFSDLKSATRNFRPDSLLGEGGFGCVFKGWIDEHGTMPVKPGTGLTVAVKTLNHNGLQGHKEWVVSIIISPSLSFFYGETQTPLYVCMHINVVFSKKNPFGYEDVLRLRKIVVDM